MLQNYCYRLVLNFTKNVMGNSFRLLYLIAKTLFANILHFNYFTAVKYYILYFNYFTAVKFVLLESTTKSNELKCCKLRLSCVLTV